ncbi:putative O-glycosylation ligase, exosortase A system-associated [Nitrosomonas sp. Nm132]|jgi:probable O-glycosylation ligase (exosortase A-associated)|uniref:putative O-glycosylation ligase, exosortase A system-associated n=1 Tax=Nitrosomonas sp. Nm132 TaxID=1881053 RepID=UPI0008886C65|nr:putative O-glycosylation ligase, exosortase A system-associated [Nitrosomonas sp. Nm132]SDH63469.1 probable O-glycosylation ligase, exosortase A-associated [Nitrosomonas sp. Nm132]
MRDLLVAGIVFGALPFVLSNPHIGVLLWSWIGYMNPHRLGWGFAYNFPFALIIAGTVIVSLLVSRKKLDFFWTPAIGWLLLLNIWFLITTIFSLQPEESWVQWNKVIKIQFFVFVTLWVMGDRKKIESLIWIIVISIGFYGVKGGAFTLATGGAHHVLGPATSFISGNTEIGLALVMIVPLVWYLFLHTANKWIRFGLIVAMLLISIAILGTQSRGALLAIAAIAFFLWLKSRKKLVPLMAILFMIPFVFMFMPQQWHERMETIKNYEEDGSAMGRITAWTFAYKLASARPLTGGGFESFNEANYEYYAPGLVNTSVSLHYPDVHSIYFEMLGEQGFVGLAIFLILGLIAWRTANKIMGLTKQSADHRWAYDLASMIQVGLVGYAVGGAFLGLSYFDLPYHFLVILILTSRIVQQQFATNHQQSRISGIAYQAAINPRRRMVNEARKAQNT